MIRSTVVLAAVALVLVTTAPAGAAERVSADELRNLVVGKKLQDVDRADHWIRPAADGTGVGGSRGREFDFTFEIKEAGIWCRNIPKARQDRYRCQTVTRDGNRLTFTNEDGSPASTMRVE